jgi:hypothetical protein
MKNLNLLVESAITALHFDGVNREMIIDVRCAWEPKERRRLVVKGIDDLLIDDMRPGSIIDRVSLYGKEDSMDDTSECASSLFFLMQKRELNATDLEWPAFKDKRSLIQEDSLTLMVIEPVFGASIIALAESIRLEAMSD